MDVLRECLLCNDSRHAGKEQPWHEDFNGGLKSAPLKGHFYLAVFIQCVSFLHVNVLMLVKKRKLRSVIC